MIIVQLAIIFAFLGLGELIVSLSEIPVPSSIIGMLSLTLSLQLKVVRLRWVSGVAEFMTRNLGFFFIPAGVSLMLYFDIIAKEWIPIVTASALSTVIVLYITGHVHQRLRKMISHNTHSEKKDVQISAK